MTRRYVHGDQVDEPWVQYNSSNVGTAYRCYLHADHQGSIIAHSDNNGNVLNILSYDSYGIPALSNQGRFAYTGQMFLPELGVYHYRARVYDPFIGRFLQTDPIGYEDQMNLYAYVHNDPLNFTDPTGKWGFPMIPMNDAQKTQVPRSGPQVHTPSPFPSSGTASASATGTLSFGTSVTASVSGSVDSKGGMAVSVTGGLGAGSPGASVEVGMTRTNADSVQSLEGLGSETSVTVGEGVVATTGIVAGQDYEGVQTSVGAGVGSPVGANGHITQTKNVIELVPELEKQKQ